MSYPKIKFAINKSLDKRMTYEFLKDGTKAGLNFAEGVLKIHPDLKIAQRLQGKEKISAINKYVDKYYDENSNSLLLAKSTFQKEWDVYEKNFFQAAEGVFGRISWPKGQYKGFISIIPSGPRFIGTKTWQTPYLTPQYFKAQVIHEVLHFQFFNLVNKLKISDQLTEDQLWHLSEIFNDIVQREPEFEKIQGYKKNIGYPDHISIHKKYLSIWQRSKNAKLFILNAMKEIRKDF